MKVNNIIYKLKHQKSTLVIRGSYMFELTVSKDMTSMPHKKRGGSWKGSRTFMSNTTIVVKKLEISVEQGKVVTTLLIIKH